MCEGPVGRSTPAGLGILVAITIIAGLMLVAGSVQNAAAQNSPMVGMLEQDGWSALQSGDAVRGAKLFEEATKLDPNNAALWFGAGIAEVLQRNDPAAKSRLERALELDPQLTRARAQLAQVVKRQGDLLEAIRLYEKVAADLPGDEGVRETLERWKRERDLHDSMRTDVGDHFTVSFAGPEDSTLAAQALESLNKAFWRISDVFAFYPQRSIPVILYTTEQFRDITRSPTWAAAAFDGAIRVPLKGAAERGAELDRVLAHEFTHALIRSVATKNVPAWLNEGLASALELDDTTWATAIVERMDALPSLTILSQPFGKLSDADAQLAYAVSTVAAKRLLDDAGGAAIASLLRDLGDGVAFETAFLHRIQKSLADFETELRK